MSVSSVLKFNLLMLENILKIEFFVKGDSDVSGFIIG